MRLVILSVLCGFSSSACSKGPAEQDLSGPEQRVGRFTESLARDLTAISGLSAQYSVRSRSCLVSLANPEQVFDTEVVQRFRAGLTGFTPGGSRPISSLAEDVKRFLDSAAERGGLDVNPHPFVVTYTPGMSLQSWGAAGQRMFHQSGPALCLETHEATSVVSAYDPPGRVLIYEPAALVGLLATGQAGADEVRRHDWTQLTPVGEVRDRASRTQTWQRNWEGAPDAKLCVEWDAQLGVRAAAIFAGDRHVDVVVLERVEGSPLPRRAWVARVFGDRLTAEELVVEPAGTTVTAEDLRLPVRAEATLRDRRVGSVQVAAVSGVASWPEEIRSLVQVEPAAPMPAGH